VLVQEAAKAPGRTEANAAAASAAAANAAAALMANHHHPTQDEEQGELWKKAGVLGAVEAAAVLAMPL
jgi:hypothetical protein